VDRLKDEFLANTSHELEHRSTVTMQTEVTAYNPEIVASTTRKQKELRIGVGVHITIFDRNLKGRKAMCYGFR